MIRNLIVVAAVAAAGIATGAAPASAACFGTENIGVVCAPLNVDGTLYEDCIHTGSSSCTPVSVPGPRGCAGGGGPNWETAQFCLS